MRKPISTAQLQRAGHCFSSLLSSRRVRIIVLLLLAFAVMLVIVGEELNRHIVTIEHWVGSLGLAGKLSLIPLYALLTCLLFPDTFLKVGAGA